MNLGPLQNEDAILPVKTPIMIMMMGMPAITRNTVFIFKQIPYVWGCVQYHPFQNKDVPICKPFDCMWTWAHFKMKIPSYQ